MRSKVLLSNSTTVESTSAQATPPQPRMSTVISVMITPSTTCVVASLTEVRVTELALLPSGHGMPSSSLISSKAWSMADSTSSSLPGLVTATGAQLYNVITEEDLSMAKTSHNKTF